ncbi:MAG: hypothetical protein ABWZ64_08080, partial [Xanthobacteraceae bacterium]
ALWVGDVQAANRFTSTLLDHSTRHSLPYWHFWGRCFDAALKLQQGEIRPAESCLDLLRDPLFGVVHLEMVTTSCEQPFGANTIARADEDTTNWCRPEILRIEGEAVLKGADPDATTAEILFRRSLDEAREHGAHSWELRTASSLAQLWRRQGRGREARNLLAPVYARFTEGFGTPDVRRAKSLLDKLVASGDGGKP